ncbi:MAG TPA: amino acid ABC transporter permease [Candidatus Bathyarchaeia archaeon]|nr:amino acid ABC transporter permease [Candidatus Bathyarchaeia archaeon]
MINIDLICQNFPALLNGVVLTLHIAAISSCIGIVLGIILAFAQQVPFALVRWVVTAYITFTRGTPMFTQILFAFYVLPQFGITFAPLSVAIIAIGLNSACYVSQIVRSGIFSVSKGQKEAARVLGFSGFQIARYIVLPQAIRAVIPALGNEAITLVKDSSLASVIGVGELSRQGSVIISRTYDAITIFAAMTMLYLLITSTISYIVAVVERKMNIHA